MGTSIATTLRIVQRPKPLLSKLMQSWLGWLFLRKIHIQKRGGAAKLDNLHDSSIFVKFQILWDTGIVSICKLFASLERPHKSG